ncbi:MAG: hypothetical protein ACKPBA_07330 [Planctomycetota bacterium]
MILRLFAVALAGACVAQSVSAAIVVTNNSTIWNAQVVAGGMTVETETFNAIADGFYSSPFGGSTASVTWFASATNGFVVRGGVFSTSTPETLSFNFRPGVRAVAGNFFGTNFDFSIAEVYFAVALSNGTTYEGYANSREDFTGFRSTTSETISHITITVQNATGSQDVFPSVDNLYFGVPVPAPGAIALLGAAGLIGYRRRR